MSGLMAIGSPALITYSLSLTILNRYWIRRRLGRLKRPSQRVKYLAPHISGRVSAAMELLQDAQQAPLRVSQEDGWLSSLVVLRENQAFWKTVKRNLRITRRGLSASLFAQSKLFLNIIVCCLGTANLVFSAHGVYRLSPRNSRHFSWEPW